MNVPEIERKSIAGRTLVGLAIAALIFGLATLYIVYSISHSIYLSAYYTIASMFDAIGINVGPALNALAPAFSTAFDEIILITVIDGIAKIVAVGLALAAIIEIITGTALLSKVNTIAARRLKDHVIVCGYAKMSERLCNELQEHKVRFLVVDINQDVVEMLHDRGYIAINGDFTNEDVLKSAAVERARAVVFATKNDTANLLGIVTARHLNSNVRIVSRVSEEDIMTKMQRAGAEQVVIPEVLTGIELGSYIRSKVR
ncbi:MAG: NAD-binding protein [Candidatus Marsarchaeota archaeon]|nr:NAD-binding protein [Candidatus Marsarchaeota archaeon]MCL5111944.1 NAD-binding protein [Candidatus Marsarchaeota archaeon]